jgi:hypothetical protein
VSPTLYDMKKPKDQLQSFMASSESGKDPCKWQILEEPKWMQLDKVLCKWFAGTNSKTKHAWLGLWHLNKRSAYSVRTVAKSYL